MEIPEGYEVTPDGRVFSWASNWRGYGRRELAQTLNKDGYPSVRLTIATGKRVRRAVHVLVAQKYLGPRPSPAHEVRHLDGDKLNPAKGNLAWGTQKENAADRDRHGRTCQGARHHKARLNEADVRLIRARAGQQTAKSIAMEYGLDPSTIQAVIRRESWKSVE